ncbi:MAG: sensor histidine kinase [Ginsengibacter sp.]
MSKQHYFLRYKFHHLVFWLGLFAGWYFFRYQDFPDRHTALLVTSIKVIDLAIMVYFTNYVLIPCLLYKKKYLLFAGLFFIFVCITSLFKIVLLQHILFPGENLSLFNEKFKERVYDNVIPHFLLVSTGAAFKLLADYGKVQRSLVEMGKEKAEAELSFLKSQINPHFLFNSLNSVYFLIDKNNADARNALHTFSKMLRYQLYEINGQKIPLEKEIGYIHDYIHLQRLRHEENCDIKLHIGDDVGKLFIEPLLLVPFVENSFKHLSHYNNEKRNQIQIDLTSQKEVITLKVMNTTEPKNPDAMERLGGIGLSNVRRRLVLLYPDRHKLDILENEGRFDVKLVLDLNHNS